MELFSLFAHIKWFVPVDKIVSNEKLVFRFSDPIVISWIFVLLGLFILGFVLEKFLGVPDWLERFGQSKRSLILKIFKALIGIFFLFAAYDGILVAPIFRVVDWFDMVLSGLFVLVGFMFLIDLLAWAAALLLIVAYFGVMIKFGFWSLIEHLHLVGIALFILMLELPWKEFSKKWKQLALPILRVLTGVALIILAFSEKLLHPEMGLYFLHEYSWNFMQQLGFEWFDDYIFTISAGMTELAFGFFFLFGWVTRLNTLALGLCMLSTAWILGFGELIGHLPIFAIAIIFLVYGSGERLKIFRNKK